MAEKRSEGRAWHRHKAFREGFLGEVAFELTSKVEDARHTRCTGVHMSKGTEAQNRKGRRGYRFKV